MFSCSVSLSASLPLPPMRGAGSRWVREQSSLLAASFILKNSSFYQDRLGTGIRNVEKREVFSQVRRRGPRSG